jgi:hypothetical protein
LPPARRLCLGPAPPPLDPALPVEPPPLPRWLEDAER